MHRLRRSFLYMPGTDWRKIEKAAIQLDADCVCMDLEDGVALSRKAEARQTVVRALQSLDFGRSERWVRVNSMDSELINDDLAEVLPARPDGIVLPKVRSGEHLRWLSEQIASVEQAHNRAAAGAIKLIAIIESARGVVYLREICQATPRLVALIFGAEDFTSDIAAMRTPQGQEVLYARSKVVTYAKAFGLQAIDIVFTNFRDPEGFVAEARQGMMMGYDGKQLIHPRQIELIHQVYLPTADEVAHARRVVEAYRKHQASGSGAFALDGKMVDMPVVKAAQQVLARAQTHT